MNKRESRIQHFRKIIRNKEDYELFNRYFIDFANTLDSFKSSKVTSDQVKNGLENRNISYIDKEIVETVMSQYDQLGIISSEMKTSRDQKIYHVPDYHGKGSSNSWSEILDELKDEMVEAERLECRESEPEKSDYMVDIE